MSIYESWIKSSQLEVTQKDRMPQEIEPTTDLGQAEDIAKQAPNKAQDDFNIDDIDFNELDDTPIEAPEPEIAENAPVPTGQNRETEVKNTVKALSEHINSVAKSVYQMNLTTNQSQELTTKVVTMISDYISSITVERVKNIAEEFLKVEAKRKINACLNMPYNMRHAYKKIISSINN